MSLGIEHFSKFFGQKEIEMMLRENFRFDEERSKQLIQSKRNQKRFTN